MMIGDFRYRWLTTCTALMREASAGSRDQAAANPETIVIAASPADYVRQLKQIAEERDRGGRAQP